MKKDEKLNYYKSKCELYKQYIQLLGGPQALDRIEQQWNIEQTDKVLSIENPEQFNKQRLEYSILNNI